MTDCLTECEKIGSCCRLLVLWGWGIPWPQTPTAEKAQEEIDERGYPFKVVAEGTPTDSDKHAWYLTCEAVMDDGLCGIYDNRPELCRSFEPGKDRPCIKHPEGEQTKARFEAGITRRIEPQT